MHFLGFPFPNKWIASAWLPDLHTLWLRISGG